MGSPGKSSQIGEIIGALVVDHVAWEGRGICWYLWGASSDTLV